MNFFRLLTIILFTGFSTLSAQKEWNNWYFGNQAGITFNTSDGSPETVSVSSINSMEGCSSVSDENGILLFYTDGVTVYNKEHKEMKNGTNLRGSSYSTQSTLIVADPSDENKYYIFTVDAREGNQYGFRYNIVDISRENGLGEVVVKNIQLAQTVTEKLVSVMHRDNDKIWVVIHKWGTNEFLSYLISDQGISPNPVSSRVGSNHQGDLWNMMGYLKASIQGDKLGCGIFLDGTFEIFDFDNSTGIVSNPIKLTSSLFVGAYGLEFSPDGKRLYLSIDNWTDQSDLYWVDLTQKDAHSMMASMVKIFSHSNRNGALQLGPDNRIYHARYQSKFLGVINNPNGNPDNCDYIQDGVNLNTGSTYWGLPNLSRPFPKKTETCQPVFKYLNFKSINDLNLCSSASPGDSVIMMTGKRTNQFGACWYREPVPVSKGFKTMFSFRFREGSNSNCEDNTVPGADGIAFVIQNISNTVTGGSGGGIGYDDIPNSVAIEFDTFKNDSTQIIDLHDPESDHIAVMSLGVSQNNPDHNSGSCMAMVTGIPPFMIDGTIYYCMIDYENGILTIYLGEDITGLQTVLKIQNFNLSTLLQLKQGEKAYVGFTSATGCAYEYHEICSWDLCYNTSNFSKVESTQNIIENNMIFPNPFTGNCSINLELIKPGDVDLTLYNSLGEKVYSESIGDQEAGTLRLNRDFSNLPIGVYILSINTNNSMKQCKMIKTE